MNLPVSLQERLKASLGALFSDVAAAFDLPKEVSLRANRLKTDADRVAALLRENGIAFTRAAWYEDAFFLHGVHEDAVRRLPAYERGEIYLQNASSMLPPLFLAPAAGESILDMAAAPGGKTTQLLALSGGRALVTACERDGVRFARLRFNLARQGAERVNAMHRDALTLDDFLRFDKILLDAPCTGTGTIAAGSDVRFSDAYLKKCAAMQQKLLAKALRLLKKGGTLVYSTCSVLREENDEAIARAQAAGAKLLPLVCPPEVPRLPSPEGTIAVRPTQRYEGFFLAKLVKE